MEATLQRLTVEQLTETVVVLARLVNADPNDMALREVYEAAVLVLEGKRPLEQEPL